MGLIDRTLPFADTADGFPAPLSPAPVATGAETRAFALRTVVALAARLSGDCPPMLVPGLLVRLAEAADTDPDDAIATAVAARTLSGYLAEHGIPLHALPEAGLVLGDDGVHTRLTLINAAMARLEALVAELETQARLVGYFRPAECPPWRAVGLGEARVRRGVLSSARIRSRLQA